jgi:hypothetical protein
MDEQPGQAACKVIIEECVRLGDELERFRVRFGEEALLGLLAPIVDRVREAERREMLEDWGRGWR